MDVAAGFSVPVGLVRMREGLGMKVGAIIRFLHGGKFRIRSGGPGAQVNSRRCTLLMGRFKGSLPGNKHRHRQIIPRHSRERTSSIGRRGDSRVGAMVPRRFEPGVIAGNQVSLSEPRGGIRRIRRRPISIPIRGGIRGPIRTTATTGATSTPIRRIGAPRMGTPRIRVPRIGVPRVGRRPRRVGRRGIVMIRGRPTRIVGPRPMRRPGATGMRSAATAATRPTTSTNGSSSRKLFQLGAPGFRSGVGIAKGVSLGTLGRSAHPGGGAGRRHGGRQRSGHRGFTNGGTKRRSNGKLFGGKPGSKATEPNTPIGPKRNNASTGGGHGHVGGSHMSIGGAPKAGTHPSHPGSSHGPHLHGPIGTRVDRRSMRGRMGRALTHLAGGKGGGGGNTGCHHSGHSTVRGHRRRLVRRRRVRDGILGLARFIATGSLTGVVSIPIARIVNAYVDVNVVISVGRHLSTRAVGVMTRRFNFRARCMDTRIIRTVGTSRRSSGRRS